MTTHPTLSLMPLLGLSAYLVTSIFYVFPSGAAQPAHFLLLFTIAATVLFAWRRLPRDPRLYVAIGSFITWVMTINTIWFFIAADYSFLHTTLFYFFNAILFLFVIGTGNHDFARLRFVAYWSCIAALFVQLLYLQFFDVNEAARAIGTFNNPNQLGYWAVLVMGCLAVVKERQRLHFADVLTLAAGLYIVTLSSSRAATAAAVILVLLIIAICKLDRSAWFLAAILLVVGLVVVGDREEGLNEVGQKRPVANLLDRFEEMTEDNEQAWSRGYDRLLAYPHYIAFGAGEGRAERFSTDSATKEFHSSIGNTLFSYGIVGLSLLCLLLFFTMSSAPWASLAYFCPIMLYGLTHMGLRFSLFWVFLGLIYAQARHRARRRYSRGRAFRSRPARRSRGAATVASLPERSGAG